MYRALYCGLAASVSCTRGRPTGIITENNPAGKHIGLVNGMRFTGIALGYDPDEGPLPVSFQPGAVHRLEHMPLYMLVRLDDVGCLRGKRLTVNLPGADGVKELEDGVVPLFPTFAFKPFTVSVAKIRPELVTNRVMGVQYDILRKGFASTLAYGSSDFKIQGDGLDIGIVHCDKIIGKDKVRLCRWANHVYHCVGARASPLLQVGGCGLRNGIMGHSALNQERLWTRGAYVPLLWSKV